MTEKSTAGYSTIQITLHWIIAALVAFQLLLGDGVTNVREAAEEGTTASGLDLSVSIAHYWFGIAILALLAARIVVRFHHGVPAPSNPSWTDWAAKLIHWAFYAMLFAMPVLGLLTVYVSDSFGDIHKLGKPIFVALIAVHIIGAFYHQFVKRDGALRRIVVPAR